MTLLESIVLDVQKQRISLQVRTIEEFKTEMISRFDLCNVSFITEEESNLDGLTYDDYIPSLRTKQIIQNIKELTY